MPEPSAWALERAKKMLLGNCDYEDTEHKARRAIALAFDDAVADHVAMIEAMRAALRRLFDIADHISSELIVVPGDDDMTDAHVVQLTGALMVARDALALTPTTVREREEPRGCPTPGACSCR